MSAAGKIARRATGRMRARGFRGCGQASVELALSLPLLLMSTIEPEAIVVSLSRPLMTSISERRRASWSRRIDGLAFGMVAANSVT